MSEYCENCRILQAENNRLKNYTCGFTDCVYMQKGKKLEAEISVLRSANKSLEVKVEALEAENSDLKSKIKELCPTPSPEFEATCQSIIKALEAGE